MPTILALRGRGHTGKSQTLRQLHYLLIENGFQLVESNVGRRKVDFISIFKKGDFLIGITSAGDFYKIVRERVGHLLEQGCEIVICACRTSDRIIPGTNAAILEFVHCEHRFIEKTEDGNVATQATTNEADARNILEIVEEIINR